MMAAMATPADVTYSCAAKAFDGKAATPPSTRYQGVAANLGNGAAPPESENPGTLAGVTGADEMILADRCEDTFIRIRDAIPDHRIRAFAALHQAMLNLRCGMDHTESLARALHKHLGPRELLLMCDAAGMAYRKHHEVEL
jgi:hypothetical protein